MDYDPTAGAYRLTLPLKQGAYNYRYLAVDRRTERPIEGLIEETSTRPSTNTPSESTTGHALPGATVWPE